MSSWFFLIKQSLSQLWNDWCPDLFSDHYLASKFQASSAKFLLLIRQTLWLHTFWWDGRCMYFRTINLIPDSIRFHIGYLGGNQECLLMKGNECPSNLWLEFLITNIPVNALLRFSCYCVLAAGRQRLTFSWAHSIWNRVTAQSSIVPVTADAEVSLLCLLAHYATFYDPDLHTNPASERFFSCKWNRRQHPCSLSPCTEHGQVTGLMDPTCFLWA